MSIRTPSHAVRTLYGEAKAKYVVIAEGGEAPTKHHNERWMAAQEADRLAIKHPGQIFHVAKIKSTVVAGEARPKGEDNYRKQMTARAEMEPGMWVKVRPAHHQYAGEVGYITSLGAMDADDTSVWVKIGVNMPPIRFSPSSLMVQKKGSGEDIGDGGSNGINRIFGTGDLVTYHHRGEARKGKLAERRLDGRWTMYDIINGENVVGAAFGEDEISLIESAAERIAHADAKSNDRPKADDTTAAPEGLGGIIARLAAMAIVEGLRRRAGPTEEDKGGYDAESMSQYHAGRSIPAGTPVYVIGQDMGFFGTAHPGMMVGPHPNDVRMVIVDMDTSEGKSDRQTINASRVRRQDDPAFIVA